MQTPPVGFIDMRAHDTPDGKNILLLTLAQPSRQPTTRTLLDDSLVVVADLLISRFRVRSYRGKRGYGGGAGKIHPHGTKIRRFIRSQINDVKTLLTVAPNHAVTLK